MRPRMALQQLMVAGSLALALALGLVGCKGEGGAAGPAGPAGPTGATGPTGPTGPPGLPAPTIALETCVVCHGPGGIVDIAVMHSTAPANVLQATIASVTVPATPPFKPTVNFTATLDGQPLTTLTRSNVRFAIAKLVPAADASGDSDTWQSYINRTETASGTAGPGDPPQPVFTSAVQATTESGSATGSVLVHNGSGNYSYTFAADLGAITTPFAVAYAPTLTHRVAIQFSGLTDVSNPTFDFVPATGAPVTPPGREIVQTASCNECHDKLALHGGGRIETRYCVTCHNPGSPADVAGNPVTAHYNLDAQSGNTIDFKVMIHKIHRGRELPSVEAGGEYIIWGFGESPFDAFRIGYPQDIRHCGKCHDTGKGAAGGNWQSRPTIQTCTACHDDISFVSPVPAGTVLHSGGARADNTSCAGCHPATTGGVIAVAEAHRIFAEEAAGDFRNNIVSTAFDPATRLLSVRFSVTDPLPGAGFANPAAGGASWNILTDAPFTQGSNSTLGIIVGWPTNEFTNAGSGNGPAQPLRVNALTSAVDNADGTYTVSATLPPGFDAVQVAIEGHPAVTNPRTSAFERIPVPNVFARVNTGAAPVARRQVVDVNKCNACHAIRSLHGNNRTDVIEVCVMCHNPDATDINRRPANPGTTLDLKAEEAIDFKRLIHAIHGTEKRDVGAPGYVVYGFGGTPHDFGARDPITGEVVSATGEAVFYPARVNNCLMCHVNTAAFTLPIKNEVRATTVSTGADRTRSDDDLNITRTAAVCSACHNNPTLIGHMERQGASFSVLDENIGP